MAEQIIKFPRPFRQPPPPDLRDSGQFELWDLPKPPFRDTPQTLLAEIAAEFAAISDHLNAVAVGLTLLESLHDEDETS